MRNKQNIVIFVLFAVAGVATLTLTRAATFTAAAEIEKGTISGCATSVGDAAASDASAVRLGEGPNCPPTQQPGENVFTLASVPDTQVEVLSDSGATQRFNGRMQWLANNKNALNLKYVWQVGDLQDYDDPEHLQYVRASNGLKILEQANVPYGLSVGNHDTAIVCPGGSACPGIDVPREFRNVNTWHSFYPPSRFPGITTLCSEFATYRSRLLGVGPAPASSHNSPEYIESACATRNTTDNAFRTFTAGGLKWLLINYEMWPRQAVQEWMKIVIERHPKHNVILFTHMHLDGGGNIPTDFGGYGSPAGTPKKVFDNVISQYPNVRFTFSGHTGVAACATFTGVNGNKIYSYLDNRREGAPIPNHVRLMTMNISARTATSKLYSPINDQTLTQGSNCNLSGVNWVQ